MKVCCLIGHPVRHSMSAVIHNAVFVELGLDYRYELWDIVPKKLEEAVDRLRELKIRGANVTIPHKVSVMEFLDAIEVDASKIGAVNTIVNDEGFLTGYNTDVTGIERSLKEAGVNPEGKVAVMVGAGGAAKAIGYHLSTLVESLTIFNRTKSRAKELASHLSGLPECVSSVYAYSLNRRALADVLVHADILVNATSLGMTPNVDTTPVEGSLMKTGLIVVEAVYNPLKTRLMREAEETGATAIGGLSMLVHQGAKAFELWTGLKAQTDLMSEAARRTLEGVRL
jgi:shikimate dehydrogenase